FQYARSRIEQQSAFDFFCVRAVALVAAVCEDWPDFLLEEFHTLASRFGWNFFCVVSEANGNCSCKKQDDKLKKFCCSSQIHLGSVAILSETISRVKTDVTNRRKIHAKGFKK